ncbi:hypothetical protein [Falsiroseomonas sp.]|uniref:hypothetical protein n=1 Tax=Falsiroseomonas sp. TaxID=2870721 RepID=UPI0034A32579
MSSVIARAAFGLAFSAALVGWSPAWAQRAAAAASAGGTTITVPLQELPGSDSLGERLWSGAIGMLGFGPSASEMMRSASDTARRHSRARDDFAWLMDVAGYKLKEIESAVSLFPSLSLTFGHARELTEADRDYVERQLERHARRNPGPLQAMQRAIVRTVLDAGEIGGFSVEKVEIDLFPLPKLKFVLAPADAPVGIDAARILRSIDRLNQRLQGEESRPRTQEVVPAERTPVARPAAPAALRQ